MNFFCLIRKIRETLSRKKQPAFNHFCSSVKMCLNRESVGGCLGQNIVATEERQNVSSSKTSICLVVACICLVQVCKCVQVCALHRRNLAKANGVLPSVDLTLVSFSAVFCCFLYSAVFNQQSNSIWPVNLSRRPRVPLLYSSAPLKDLAKANQVFPVETSFVWTRTPLG